MDRLFAAWMANRTARWITPAGHNAKPWIGEVVNPKYSELGAILRHSDTAHYVIVRCIDPCDVRGMIAGEDYLVRTSFVQSPPETAPEVSCGHEEAGRPEAAGS